MRNDLQSTHSGLSRRRFLQALGLAGSALSAGPVLALDQEKEPFVLERPGRWQIFRLVRPRDMLALNLELVNLRVIVPRQTAISAAELHLASHGKPGYIILQLPGQHIAEQAIWDRSNPRQATNPSDKPESGEPPAPTTYKLNQAYKNESQDEVEGRKTKVNSNNDDLRFLARDRYVGEHRFEEQPQGLAGAWLSGPTQLVFEVPKRMLPFQFEADTILDLCARALPLVVSPLVSSSTGLDNDGQPIPAMLQQPWVGHHSDEDAPPFTSIEFPTLLYLSPYADAHWRQRPLTGSRRSELWSLELERPAMEPVTGVPREIRARGHVFAFNWRSVEQVLWPQAEQEAAPNSADDKYGANERAKTTLYEATRELVVKQLAENNGDITAQRLQLSSLGATARLQYRAAFEPSGQQEQNGEGQARDNVDRRLGSLRRALEACGKDFKIYEKVALDGLERSKDQSRAEVLNRLRTLDLFKALSVAEWGVVMRAFVPFPEVSDGQGLLLEWLQKTEVGRDFYTKESFTGFWMPFGFKAEVVTITERLPCTNNPATTSGDLVELRDQEANLTGFLVARKFGRVRRGRDGTLKREFQPTESTDFAPWLATLGRVTGLRAVEVLVERTPVLANRGTDAMQSPTELDRAIRDGNDLLVDSGNGKNAAREIFWPRVEDFEVANADKKFVRKLVIYKFPLRLTYLDGTQEVIQLPMLFVPTLSQGALYYPKYPASLRTASVTGKVPVVDPPAPASLAGEELGSEAVVHCLAEELKGVTGEEEVHKLVDSTKGGAGSAAGTAAGLELIASSVNVFLDNLPSEIAKRLTVHREEVANFFKEELSKADENLESGWQRVMKEFQTQIEKLGRDAKQARNLVERSVAWGMEETGAVDAAAAAERLVLFLTLPTDAEEIWRLQKSFSSIQQTMNEALVKLSTSEQRLSEAKEQILRRVGKLKEELDTLPTANREKLDQALSAVRVKYAQELRELSIQWAIRLAPYWHREFWDEPFRKLARFIDPSHPALLITAVLHKEMHYAVIGGKADIALKLGDKPELKVSFDQLAAGVGDMLPRIRPEALAREMDAALEHLVRPALEKVEVLNRVLLGVEAGMPEERMLRQRLHAIIEQYGRLKEAQKLEVEVRAVLDDLRSHLTYVVAHYLDGEARFSRFLAKSMAASEIAALVERRVGDRVNQLKQIARQAVAERLERTQLAKVQKSIEGWLSSANPEHIKQRLEDMLELTGGRMAGELSGRLSRAGDSVGEVIAAMHARLSQPPLELRRTTAELTAQMDELAAEGEAILGKYKKLVETFLLRASGNELRQQVARGLRGLNQHLGQGSLKPIGVWLERVILQLEGRLLSPRLLNRLEEVTSAVLERGVLLEDGVKWLTGYRDKVQLMFVEELKGKAAFTQAEFQQLCDQLQARVGQVEIEIQQRANALAELAKDESCHWLDLTEQLFLGLAAVPKDLEAQLKPVVETLLRPLVDSELRGLLGPTWGRVQALMNDLRGYVGDARDFQHAVERLSGKVGDAAKAKLKDLQQELATIGSGLQKDLARRAKNVEGEALSFVKRALVSLPSPQLLNQFGDQTTKAVFKARALVFTAASIGEGLRSSIAHPKLESLTVKLPGVPDFMAIKHADEYLNQGLRDFNAAKGQVFAEILQRARASGELAGIGAAAAEVKWLSRQAGALSDAVVADMRNYGAFAQETAKKWAAGITQDLDEFKRSAQAKLNASMASILGSPPPKLFNQIELSEILKYIQNPGEIPKAISKEFPDRVENVLAMQNTPDKRDAGLLQFLPQEGTELRMESRTTAWLPLPGRPNRGISNTVRGQLGPFKLVIGNVIGISFQSLTFVAENGDFKCHPKLGRTGGAGGGATGEASNPFDMVEFLGPLAFLQDVMRTFASYLSGVLPFRLRCDGETIFAGIQIGLPALGFGAFSMQNLSLGMAVGLPLSSKGTLQYRFNIADRVETFKLSVCGFTGGGFFAMNLSSDPNQGGIEAALEFGGSLALNIGIAQGALSVMAGVYYHKRGPEVMLDAYLRACGVVVVLGFIEVSVVFYLAMQYHNGGLAGQASITIRIKIGFFSRSFRLSYSKTIAGSGSSHSTAYLENHRARIGRETLYAALGPDGLALSDGPRYGYGFPTSGLSMAATEPTDSATDAGPRLNPRRFTDRMTVSEWNEHWSRFDHNADHIIHPEHGQRAERRRYPRCVFEPALEEN